MAILGTIMGVVIGLPIIGYLVSPAVKVQKLDDWISLGPLDNYPIGVPIFFNFTRTRVNGWEKTVNSYGVYVYRKDENQLKVFSDICTHLACRFKWHMDIKEFVCPCHDGHFDIEGYVTKGPPPRPLDQYEYKIEDGVVQIYLMKG
jgi:Rieske Fe-S protein